MATAYEPWVGSETFINGSNEGSSWDQVSFGTHILPGLCTVDGLEIGITCDIQKRKKREKAVVRDLGMNPSRFRVVMEIRSAQWAAFLKMLPNLRPSEGKARTPYVIVHPLVNANGIQTVYIQGIKYDSPSARKGMKVTFDVVEWLAEVKEKTTKPTKKVDARPPGQLTNNDRLIGPPVSDPQNVYENMFGDRRNRGSSGSF